VNVVLFLGARRFFPDPGLIPEFTERKESREVDAIVAQYGVVPFTLHRTPSASASASEPEPASDSKKSFDSDTASLETLEPAVLRARDFPERVSSRRPFSAARPDFPPHQ
jgi:hypothetical protein